MQTTVPANFPVDYCFMNSGNSSLSVWFSPDGMSA
jgi:hypothetical protein